MEKREEENTIQPGDIVLWISKSAEVVEQIHPGKWSIRVDDQVFEIWESELVRV